MPIFGLSRPSSDIDMPAHSRILLRLPDTLHTWPWQRRINPHYATVSAAVSVEWIESFRVFSPKVQGAFNMCNFGLLASLAYPSATRGIPWPRSGALTPPV
ncbi:hypothetical protein GY45DRAFT_610786 [Cubamyces sp. BRFM 1775]|nr:hypothetical protein GY45DRAFT_610786 [Cubamyces sp. BRFM 1775]